MLKNENKYLKRSLFSDSEIVFNFCQNDEWAKIYRRMAFDTLQISFEFYYYTSSNPIVEFHKSTTKTNGPFQWRHREKKMGLSLTNVSKRVDGTDHLMGINLKFGSGSRNVILGRTLAGKTSLLRIMAGLDRPSSGQILINDEDVTGVSVRKRSVAMVYQQFINYPSFTVFDNIASPLKVSGLPRQEIKDRVMDVAKTLHLESMLDRLPAELSGGQQQRCAIARALVKDAHLLLLDEPLVNLDYKLREELQEELQEVFSNRKAIVVYTTTEPAEALKLGGEIIIMDEGRILQTGRTPHVYRHPGTIKVAEVFSDPPINYLSGKIKDGMSIIGKDLVVPLSAHLDELPEGDYTYGIRANHLFFKRQSPSDLELTIRIDLSEINGSETFIHGHYQNFKLVSQEVGIHSIKMGSKIPIFMNPARFFVYSNAGILVQAPDSSAHDVTQEI